MSEMEIYFEWDVHNWSKALPVWEEGLKGKTIINALELGSRNGGLSVWLVKNYNCEIICSDLTSPEESASPLHKRSGIQDKVKYKAIDITNIDLPSNSFDVVIFKSVLGALGSLENQAKAISEIHRVLKPGGVLLFAENLKSSMLHKAARSLFVRWGKNWRYVHLNELKNMLDIFSIKKIRTGGFSAIFMPSALKKPALIFDDLLDNNNIFPGLKYIAFGYAVK